MSEITSETLLAIARYSGVNYDLRGLFPTKDGEIAYSRRGDKVYIYLSLDLNSDKIPAPLSDPASLKLSDLAPGINLPDSTVEWYSINLYLDDTELYITTSYPCTLKKSFETVYGYVIIEGNVIKFYEQVTNRNLLCLELPKIGEENQLSRA